MNKISLIKERIMQIAKYYNISYEKFFASIGMSYANFRGNAKKTPINSDTLAKILTIYENIDATWLLTGVGEMLVDSCSNTSKKEADFISIEPKFLDIITNQAETILLQQKTIEQMMSKLQENNL